MRVWRRCCATVVVRVRGAAPAQSVITPHRPNGEARRWTESKKQNKQTDKHFAVESSIARLVARIPE